MTERWLPVAEYEGLYDVSSYGRVRSLWRRTPHILKPHFKPNGARPGRVNLYRGGGGQHKTCEVHCLVLTAFDGPAPNGTECCHWDGDGTNNRLENLYWGSRSQNVKDQVRHGIHNQARKTRCQSGHDFTTENTRLIEDKQTGRIERVCRECSNAAGRRYRARRKAQT